MGETYPYDPCSQRLRMSTNRLEAFSDGVIAIIITIMVLELHPPEGTTLEALRPLIPIILSYILSFVFIGIYWNNHHHLFQAAKQVSGLSLWANLHLLFWLSLIPFVTSWMGEHPDAAWPVALYGAVLWCAGLAYYILARILIAHHGQDSVLATAIGDDRKGIISLVVYTIAIPLSFVATWLAFLLYVVVAVMWLIPDQRIERKLTR
jgi:TMEM175 potassium channel family protein